MEQRIFVGNLPTHVTEEDVKGLISKICKVSSVYRPPPAPTGLNRGFAIVNVSNGEEDVTKCLKILNNTNWKGCKLRLEKASGVYYKVKMENEKKEAQEQKHLKTVTTTKIYTIPSYSGRTLRIRKSYYKIIPAIPNPKRDFSLEYVESAASSGKQAQAQVAAKVNTKKDKTSREGGGRRLGFGFTNEPKEGPACCISDEKLTERQRLIEELTFGEESLETRSNEKTREDVVVADIQFDSLETEKNRHLSILQSILKKSHDNEDTTQNTTSLSGPESGSEYRDDKNNYANLSQFKQLFDRNGGIQWGGDAKVAAESSAEISGAMEVDEIFKEAEKLGIETRQANNKPQMMFNFFDQPEDDSAEQFSSATSIPSTATDLTKTTLSKVSIAIEPETESEENKFTYPRLDNVFQIAMLFCRQKSEEEIVEEWKNTREKMIKDYKRKSKDARKKGKKFEKPATLTTKKTASTTKRNRESQPAVNTKRIRPQKTK